MILGLDIGGTNTRFALTDEDGSLFTACRVIKSAQFADAERPFQKLASILKEYIQQAGSPSVEMISAGVPATVSKDFRTVFCAPNLKSVEGKPVFDGLPVADLLSAEMGIPVLVNKDVNNLLACDMVLNHLAGTVVGCYIGTGFGTSVCIDGRFVYGKNGFAMDVGHVSILGQRGICGCGKEGCIETFASGSALNRLRREYYQEVPGEELFLRHASDSPVSAFVEACAQLPAFLLTCFDPDYVVLGGGVLEMPGFPMEKLKDLILHYTGKAVASDPPCFIEDARCPERGVIGAACFARAYYGQGNG
ncbi:MAG: ROK family protein [Oscillospiraceae bacterium]|nr:ROK family protein [Oscillospiraceae bacterium]